MARSRPKRSLGLGGGTSHSAASACLRRQRRRPALLLPPAEGILQPQAETMPKMGLVGGRAAGPPLAVWAPRVWPTILSRRMTRIPAAGADGWQAMVTKRDDRHCYDSDMTIFLLYLN